MRRIWALVLALTLLGAAQCASAQVMFDGKVAGGQTESVLAPFGGIVDSASVIAGDRIHKGDVAAVLRTTRVYAPADGTISGMFGNEGDSTEGISERYGAVMYIEPINKYTISASTEKAYNLSENKFIHIGEAVYLLCTADGSHKGAGVVTAVAEEGKYTIEVTAGEFSMGETVGIFRRESHASTSRIGRGTVAATKAVPVKGTGSILKLHVKNGDGVERGELLFDTVDGALDGLYAPGDQVLSEITGIVSAVDAAPGTAVEKGGKIMTVYPDESLCVEMGVGESDLNEVKVGMPVTVVFGWDPDQEKRVPGTVTRISYINSAESGEPQYTAYVHFEPDDSVRLGMTVVVYTPEAAEETPETGAEIEE